MNKGQLIELVAKDTGTSKAATARVIDSVFANIQKGLKKDKKVQLIGFGTFDVRKRKARKGRNPQTGEQIKIPAKRVCKFRLAKSLKDAVLGK